MPTSSLCSPELSSQLIRRLCVYRLQLGQKKVLSPMDHLELLYKPVALVPEQSNARTCGCVKSRACNFGRRSRWEDLPLRLKQRSSHAADLGSAGGATVCGLSRCDMRLRKPGALADLSLPPRPRRSIRKAFGCAGAGS
jgi:hypothetical protein